MDDNERLCAMEPHLRLRRFCLEQGLNLCQLDQQARAEPIELPGLLDCIQTVFFDIRGPLRLSCKMDLDFWGCLEGKIPSHSRITLTAYSAPDRNG